MIGLGQLTEQGARTLQSLVVADHHARTLVRQHPHCRRADPAAAPGDDGYLVLEDHCCSLAYLVDALLRDAGITGIGGATRADLGEWICKGSAFRQHERLPNVAVLPILPPRIEVLFQPLPAIGIA